jgi:hypothetical protein
MLYEKLQGTQNLENIYQARALDVCCKASCNSGMDCPSCSEDRIGVAMRALSTGGQMPSRLRGTLNPSIASPPSAVFPSPFTMLEYEERIKTTPPF